MWKYVLLLSIFNIGYAVQILTTPGQIAPLQTIPLLSGGNYLILAYLFLLAGLTCFFGGLIDWKQGNRNGLFARIIAQGTSLSVSAAWMMLILIYSLFYHGLISSIAGWLLVVVGQAFMLRFNDTEKKEQVLAQKIEEVRQIDKEP